MLWEVYQKLTTLVHHLRAVQEHYSRGQPLAVMVLSCMVHLVGGEGQALEHLGGLPGVIVYLEWEEEPGTTRPGSNLLPDQALSYGLLKSKVLLWSYSSSG